MLQLPLYIVEIRVLSFLIMLFQSYSALIASQQFDHAFDRLRIVIRQQFLLVKLKLGKQINFRIQN